MDRTASEIWLCVGKGWTKTTQFPFLAKFTQWCHENL